MRKSRSATTTVRPRLQNAGGLAPVPPAGNPVAPETPAQPLYSHRKLSPDAEAVLRVCFWGYGLFFLSLAQPVHREKARRDRNARRAARAEAYDCWYYLAACVKGLHPPHHTPVFQAAYNFLRAQGYNALPEYRTARRRLQEIEHELRRAMEKPQDLNPKARERLLTSYPVMGLILSDITTPAEASPARSAY